MSEELLIRHCSPTLAGIKTGSMFACFYSSVTEMRAAVRAWNRRLISKGLRILPLSYRKNRALIYIYRPNKLSDDLRDSVALRLLCERGYSTESADKCVVSLVKRMSDYEEFPHEIGLFLGYPPEDVSAFIENRDIGCKAIGCWRVYGNAENAIRIFTVYENCTKRYTSEYKSGKSVELLAVPS